MEPRKREKELYESYQLRQDNKVHVCFGEGFFVLKIVWPVQGTLERFHLSVFFIASYRIGAHVGQCGLTDGVCNQGIVVLICFL